MKPISTKLILILAICIPLHLAKGAVFSTVSNGDINNPAAWIPMMPPDPCGMNDTIMIFHDINLISNYTIGGVMIIAPAGILQNNNRSIGIQSSGKLEVNGSLIVKTIINDGLIINNSRIEIHGNLINNGADSRISGTNGVFRLQNRTINNAGGYINGTLNFCRFDEISDPMLSNSGYVDWSTVTVCGGPLPVEIISYTGKRNGSSVVLEWLTGQEAEHDYFEIEKSEDGYAFQFLSKISVSVKKDENNYYCYTDIDESPSLFYRLKQVDKDGGFSYSSIIAISNQSQHISVFPNPQDKGNSVFVQTGGKEGKVIIYNEYGRMIIQSSFDSGSGKWLLTGADKLLSGMYYLHIQTDDGLQIEKLVIH